MTVVPAPEEVRRVLDDPAAAHVLAMLDANGEEARIVGGAVRNALLGAPVREMDIATTALPDEVIRRAEAAGIGAVPTGLAHGTVTLVVDGKPFETTTLRSDVATDGRHAVVAFGRDWRADAERRDFTINALSIDREGRVHDYVGGLDDLAARKIRFIGEPRARIREDFLRILRFFRFHAAYGAGEPDKAGLAAAIEERAGLARLSAERIGQEFLKLLAAPRPVPVLAAMADAGIAGLVLGGVPRTARLRKLVEFEGQMQLAADPVLRLTALAVFVAEDAERLRVRLRLSNRDADRLAASAEPLLNDIFEAGESGWKVLLYRLGREAYRDRVLLAAANFSPAADVLSEAFSLPDRWEMPVFPVSGKTLLERGVPAGPAIGRALRGIEARWIDAGFPSGGAVEQILRTVLSGPVGEIGIFPSPRGRGFNQPQG